MGFTKDQLLARLKELQIDFSQYEHPTVSTVEAREKYVGDKGGGLCKILFLKCYLGGLVWEKEVQEWLLKKHWVRYFRNKLDSLSLAILIWCNVPTADTYEGNHIHDCVAVPHLMKAFLN
eukprot:XP_024450304.1 uncharacterized protein LOC18096218 isoform X1 [Populus trichocarpa]